MAGSSNMDRLEAIVARLPEAIRVDVEAWGDHPTFRVRNKNFVFSNDTATNLSFKLTTEEAAAVVATDVNANPAGYGLGRHGWVAYDLEPDAGDERWQEVTEWIETSYTLVAPKTLARRVHPRPDH
jgi:predicted DNA-binding protein (MmcQ/YjbR family)